MAAQVRPLNRRNVCVLKTKWRNDREKNHLSFSSGGHRCGFRSAGECRIRRVGPEYELFNDDDELKHQHIETAPATTAETKAVAYA
jgi:hypothetical protein